MGHVINQSTISIVLQKVVATTKWPEPKNVKELQMFFGLCNFYARFVKHFATIAVPLHELLQKIPHGHGRNSNNKPLIGLRWH